MQIPIKDISFSERHRLLSGVVVPRPIAFITTVSPEGKVNAAPYSWFNICGMDPPLVMVGAGFEMYQAELGLKDTARNIQLTGEFVINMVTEQIAEQMNICAVDFPPEVNELEVAGLTAVPSTDVKPPRIAESPINLECRSAMTVEVRNTRFTIGEVVRVHVPDDMIDPTTYYIKAHELGIVGRMHPPGWAYVRTTDRFNMPSISYEEWTKRSGK